MRFDLYLPSEEASERGAKLLPVRRLNKETLEGEAGLSEAACSFDTQVAPEKEQALSGPWRGGGIAGGERPKES